MARYKSIDWLIDRILYLGLLILKNLSNPDVDFQPQNAGLYALKAKILGMKI